MAILAHKPVPNSVLVMDDDQSASALLHLPVDAIQRNVFDGHKLRADDTPFGALAQGNSKTEAAPLRT